MFSVSSGWNLTFTFNYEFNQPVVAALATAAATLLPIESTGVLPSHTCGYLKTSLKFILRITARTRSVVTKQHTSEIS